MKTYKILKLRFSGIVTLLVLLFASEAIEAQVPAAHMHRATRRRTAVVVSSATHAKDQQAASAAAAQTPPPAQAAPAPAPTPAPQTALPIGTVVTVLPAGCVTLDINNVKYYQSGSNYYMAAYQGNTMVYVTSNPPQ